MSSLSALNIYNRLDKGDPECPDEADVDPTWTEAEKVLDVKEEEVFEYAEEKAPPVVEEVGVGVSLFECSFESQKFTPHNYLPCHDR